MTLAQLAAFNVTLLAAMFSPGPALLVAVQTNRSAGRRAGIAVGCGLGLMAATWTLMALVAVGSGASRAGRSRKDPTWMTGSMAAGWSIRQTATRTTSRS